MYKSYFKEMSDEEYKVEKKIQINIKKDITNIIKRKGGWEKAIKKYFDNSRVLIAIMSVGAINDFGLTFYIESDFHTTGKVKIRMNDEEIQEVIRVFLPNKIKEYRNDPKNFKEAINVKVWNSRYKKKK